MLFLLIWILCAFGCYKLADHYNRERVAWSVLGLLFGVFALLILALLGKKASETDRQVFEISKAKFFDLYAANEEQAKENPITLRTYLMLSNGETVKLEQLGQAVSALQLIQRQS